MKIHLRKTETAHIAEIQGRITMQTAHELLATIKNAIEEKAPRILIYLCNVDYMDSSGVGVLITGIKQAKKEHIPFALVGLNEKVQQVMAMSGLSALFPIYKTLEEAQAQLS